MTVDDYVTDHARETIAGMTARELLRFLRRYEGPGAVHKIAAAELDRRRAGAGVINRDRARMYARAEYYAWSARKGFPAVANDPIGGRPWDKTPGTLGRELGRAENTAAARVCYRRARAFPSPFARLAELEEQRRP